MRYWTPPGLRGGAGPCAHPYFPPGLAACLEVLGLGLEVPGTSGVGSLAADQNLSYGPIDCEE